MRENRADTTRAVVLALLLHAALVALLFVGMLFSRAPQQASAAGSPISAEFVDPEALSRATLRALAQEVEPLPEPLPEVPLPEPIPEAPEETAPAEQPLPSPVPEDSPVEPQPDAQQQLPVPDTVDQDAVRREAIARETAEREQEERRRQEQIDLTERQRQEEAEKQRRLSEMEQERQKQLADIRRQREQAERERQRLEQQQQQLAERRAQQASQAAANAAPPPGNDGSSDDLNAKYAAALQEAILRNWTRPDTVPIGQRCRIVIRQIPGGQVIDAQVDPSCPYDELGRRSVEAAVLRAQPLPYAGFESVFQRNVTLNFQAQDR